MDGKTFNNNVSVRINVAPGEIQKLTDALVKAIGSYAEEETSVAIPGFGTFTPEHTKEYIKENGDGSHTLMPPSITLTFTPSVLLRKRLQNTAK